ncbi:hypothetical protein [Dactylosporangium sp. NPDC006015]|uniref:hypothetical protein n=1 Tax=Dactylosporangium sp. NPDC006015 TaxID=3154576 RepID=UPI0033B4C64A
MHRARIGPQVSEPFVTSVVNSVWARPGPDGTITDSPEIYNLTWVSKGQMITGFNRQVTSRDLATVRADYGSQATGVLTSPYVNATIPPWRDGGIASSPDGEGPAFNYGVPFHAPFTRTVHYSTEGRLRWQDEIMEGPGVAYIVSAPTVYQPGQHDAQRWNRGVFGPSFSPRNPPYRDRDLIWPLVGLYGDGAGRFGRSYTADARTTLTRDGVEIPGSEAEGVVQFSVPAGEGTYRLQIEADRGAPGTLSTCTSVAWTFRSAYTTTRTALPLSVIRFSLKLNALNTARATGRYAVPVTVTPLPGSTATAPTTLTVEVSYDDGGSWQPAPLQRAGDQTIETLQHPNRDGFVSLRATSIDANGTKVEQTIIRAYRISTELGD